MSPPRHDGPDARQLAQELGQRAELLCRELLPHGRREGHEWRCGSIAGEAGSSLAVHLAGPRAGVWADFSAADVRGDALDLVAAVLFRGEMRAALAWARHWLGHGDGPAPAARRRAPPPPPAAEVAAAAEREAAERRRRALKLWLAAEATLTGTPAAAYLAGRGIDLARLGRQPRALRFHPHLWCEETGGHFPALVAAISADGAGHLATHRTWLAVRAGQWSKAPLQAPKKVLGSFRGGLIPLWRGASGKSLKQAPAGETIVIAEGIETGLSVALACPELRVVSAVALGNMGHLVLPGAVTTVILAFDNDPEPPPQTPPDDPAVLAARQRARARQAAIARYADEGRVVRVAMPQTPGADWNDVLQGVGA